MQTHPVSIDVSSAPLSGGRSRPVPEEVWEALRAQDLEEKMGQGGPHGEAVDLFVDVLSALLAEQRRTAYVGWDVFVEWDPSDPRARLSPDVFLLEGQPADLEPSIWCTWQPGCDPPRFALEIVSERSRAKDYETNPGKYAALGVEELVVFDPEASGPGAPRNAIPLQVFRRSPRGQFLRVYQGEGPTQSAVLGAFLVASDAGHRLRLARNVEGTDMIPTPTEQARAAREEARSAAEQARAATARAEAAEARVRQLEEELARARAT